MATSGETTAPFGETMALRVNMIVKGQAKQGEDPPALLLNDIPKSATVLDLKKIITKQKGFPVGSAKLLHGHSCLSDESLSLLDANVFSETHIMCIIDLSFGADEEATVGSEITLNILKLDGETITLEGVKLVESVGEIRARLSAITGMPAARIVLIYSGAKLEDDDTPGSMHCVDGSAIHMVLRGQDLLKDVITEDVLFANCPFCSTRGAPIEIRYRCKECLASGVRNFDTEVVKVDGGTLTVGKSRWEDILGLTCKCYQGCGKGVPCAVSFRCRAEKDGRRCPSMKPERRQMVASYCGEDRKQLGKVLGQLFGYAHFNGMTT